MAKTGAERQKTYRNRNVVKGNCIHCGRHPAVVRIYQNGELVEEEKMTRCYKCMLRQRQANKRQFEKRGGRAKCSVCQNNPAEICGICIK